MQRDGELLRRYAETGSEQAFAELVQRYLDLVFSTALRIVHGDAHQAQDVAQTVFTALARKAGVLSKRPVLTGWLYTSTHFAACKAVRTRQRREAREQEAMAMQHMMNQSEAPLKWEEISSDLDKAMQQLKSSERLLILMRYFENRRLGDIAEKTGLSEEAARKRVDRALEKLRGYLSNRGTHITVLAVVLSANAVRAAPAGMAASVASASILAAGSSAGFSVALSHLIAIAKAKAVAIGAVLVLVLLACWLIRPSQNRERDITLISVSNRFEGASTIALAPSSAKPPTIFEAIYSTDTRLFAMNLRAIGCPEETVKDIIVAEIGRRYRAQEQALRATPADHVPLLWAANTSEQKLTQRRQQAVALVREKASALKHALGYDVPVALPAFALSSSDQRFEQELLGVSSEHRSALRQAHEDYWTKVRALQARIKGFWQIEDVQELERLKEERRLAILPMLDLNSTTVTQEDSATAQPTTERPSSSSAEPSMPVPKFEFKWTDVETSDYKQYAANLRALGFPEELLQAIVIADVDKLYASREEPLKPKTVPYDAPTSEKQKAVTAADWERTKQLREVRIEKQAVIKQILGIYVPREIVPAPNSPRNYEAFEYALSLLPPEKRDNVQIALEDDWYAADMKRYELDKTNKSAFLEAYKQIRQERNKIFLQALTPEEFQLFEMNSTPVGTELARRVIGMEPTEDEFRAMFQIASDNWIETGGIYGIWRAVKLPREQIDAADEKMRVRLKETLGRDRYLDYQMSTTETGQQLRNLAARYDLSRETLVHAFALQTEFDALAKGGGPSERSQQLQQGLETLLGETIWRAWASRIKRVDLDPGNIKMKF